MARLEQLIQQACSAARITPADLATWARIDEERLRGALVGEARLSADEVDRCARVFGLRLDDLAEGITGRAPMALHLRDSLGDSLDLRGALSLELQDLLGDLQRIVRDIDELERLLRVSRPRVPRIQLAPPAPGLHEGDHRARVARKALGLGDAPIPSMRALVERCGIGVVWATLDQVDRGVDGASVLVPRPTILVNLLEEGNAYPWRVRTTLAHELSHILFDLDEDLGRALVSPTKATDPRLEDIERTARAFGPCFLAPTDAVKRLVAGMDPTSEEAIVSVGVTYGVGRTVAINRLQDVFGLTPDQRTAMEARSGRGYRGDFSLDQPPACIGFRGEPLRSLVERALVAGVLKPGRARMFLGLPATEPLPFAHLGHDLCRPAQTQEARIAQLASRHLIDQHEGWFAGEPVREGLCWRVPILESGSAQEPVLRGHLRISVAGVIEREELSPASP